MPQCYYDGKQFSEGSYLCANGHELRCENDGRWKETGYECKSPDDMDSDPSKLNDMKSTGLFQSIELIRKDIQNLMSRHNHRLKLYINGQNVDGYTEYNQEYYVTHDPTVDQNVAESNVSEPRK